MYPTELLSRDNEKQGILLYQGKEGQQSIRIDKSVFLIGKNADEVDGYIGVPSVSRVHARIEMEKDEYYIEDLNSTNGTYLNGERLEYRQKEQLKVHDRIAFGMEEYVFM